MSLVRWPTIGVPRAAEPTWDAGAGMGLIRRNPVASSVALCVLLGATLITAALVLPLRGNVDHAAGHLSVAAPVLLLLTCALLWWPPASSGLATRVARGTFVAGLAIAGLALVI